MNYKMYATGLENMASRLTEKLPQGGTSAYADCRPKSCGSAMASTHLAL